MGILDECTALYNSIVVAEILYKWKYWLGIKFGSLAVKA